MHRVRHSPASKVNSCRETWIGTKSRIIWKPHTQCFPVTTLCIPWKWLIRLFMAPISSIKLPSLQTFTRCPWVCFSTSYPCAHACMHICHICMHVGTHECMHTPIHTCTSYRYAFQVAGTLFVFVIFWILLERENKSTNSSELTSEDQTIFWVSGAFWGI